KEIERALLALADLDLQAVEGQPRLLADIVIDARAGAVGAMGRVFQHERHLEKTGEWAAGQRKLAFPPEFRQLTVRNRSLPTLGFLASCARDAGGRGRRRPRWRRR